MVVGQHELQLHCRSRETCSFGTPDAVVCKAARSASAVLAAVGPSVGIGAREMKGGVENFFEDISKVVSNSRRPLIIFPQGTRVLPGERPSFKKGASRIYENLKIVCQPVAINSGYVWPKRGPKNINKILTISILNHIEVGIPKDDFLRILEKSIYSELDILN